MDGDITPLVLDDILEFSCSKEVLCFNNCCKDLNQFLTPYDILRIRNRLEIPSAEFLEKYTSQHIGPESGLPIIRFKLEKSSGSACPFVTPAGCKVYEDRPSACRTYPLIRMATRSRETGKITEQYMLMHESHCMGFHENQSQTVREWTIAQDTEIYNEMNDLMMEIISLKNQRMPGQMDLKSKQMFHMACYDLDQFRTHIFEKGLLDDLKLPAETLDMIKQDDVALLKLGIEWIKCSIFGSEHDKNPTT
jgi:Fe-S-cluster containining protein